MNFDKEGFKFAKKKCLCVFVCVCGREGALTPKLYAKLCHLRSNTEIQLSTQCRACSKINVLKKNFEFNFCIFFFFFLILIFFLFHFF